MRQWFDALEQREKLFVGVGAIVVTVTLLWGLVWLPLDKAHQQLRQDVTNWERSLSDLQGLQAALQNGSGASSAVISSTTQTPLVVVDQTLRARGLNGSLKRRQPTSNGIRVEFENVAFDELVLWLGDLSNLYAMEVQAGSLAIANRAGPGRINATLTLERSP